MQELAVPLLALHGAADTITLPESRELKERARSTDKTHTSELGRTEKWHGWFGFSLLRMG